MYRTHTCGELNKKHAGKEVTLAGWVDSLRIQGKIGFLLLRDRYGITQFFLNPKLTKKFRNLRKQLKIIKMLLQAQGFFRSLMYLIKLRINKAIIEKKY